MTSSAPAHFRRAARFTPNYYDRIAQVYNIYVAGQTHHTISPCENPGRTHEAKYSLADLPHISDRVIILLHFTSLPFDANKTARVHPPPERPNPLISPFVYVSTIPHLLTVWLDAPHDGPQISLSSRLTPPADVLMLIFSLPLLTPTLVPGSSAAPSLPLLFTPPPRSAGLLVRLLLLSFVPSLRRPLSSLLRRLPSPPVCTHPLLSSTRCGASSGAGLGLPPASAPPPCCFDHPHPAARPRTVDDV